MNLKTKLRLFEKALADWSKPYSLYSCDNTFDGLCYYFHHAHGVWCNSLEPHWIKYKTIKPERVYHFRDKGHNKIGRAERVLVLQRVIEDIKELIEIEEKPRWQRPYFKLKLLLFKRYNLY